jgi:hypothetical protein
MDIAIIHLVGIVFLMLSPLLFPLVFHVVVTIAEQVKRVRARHSASDGQLAAAA